MYCHCCHRNTKFRGFESLESHSKIHFCIFLVHFSSKVAIITLPWFKNQKKPGTDPVLLSTRSTASPVGLWALFLGPNGRRTNGQHRPAQTAQQNFFGSRRWTNPQSGNGQHRPAQTAQQNFFHPSACEAVSTFLGSQWPANQRTTPSCTNSPAEFFWVPPVNQPSKWQRTTPSCTNSDSEKKVDMYKIIKIQYLWVPIWQKPNVIWRPLFNLKLSLLQTNYFVTASHKYCWRYMQIPWLKVYNTAYLDICR